MNGTHPLPPQIERHLLEVVRRSGLEESDESIQAVRTVWREKRELFLSQIHSLRMNEEDTLGADDPRGALVLTYSGSLLSLAPEHRGSRRLEYTSIELRRDVPDVVWQEQAALAEEIRRDRAVRFRSGPIRSTSPAFIVAVCQEGLDEREQERRIREATIFLTGSFVQINRSLTMEAGTESDQFNLKSMVDTVAARNGLTKIMTKRVIDDFLKVVETGLLLREPVSLGRLGRMSLRERPAQRARIVKSPATGEEITVPAKPKRLTPKMSFGKALKDKAAALEIE